MEAAAGQQHVGATGKAPAEAVGVADGHGADLHGAGAAVVQAVADALAHRQRLHIGDAGLHAHGRLQIDHRVGLGARVESVQRNAEAHHVQLHLWVADGGRGVRRVHDARVDAGRAQGIHGFRETLDLPLEVDGAGAVGRGEVGEGAHQIERPMERYLSREFHDLVPTHADAVHARVHLQMEGRGHPEGVGGLGVADGELGGVDRRHDLVGQKQRDGRSRGLAQNEDRGVHVGLAQGDGLVHRGHAQVLGPGVQRRFGALHGAVAVAVGLHHGHEPGSRIQALLHGRGVVADGVQVDLHPGPASIHLGNAGELVRIEARSAGSRRALLSEAQHIAGRRGQLGQGACSGPASDCIGAALCSNARADALGAGRRPSLGQIAGLGLFARRERRVVVPRAAQGVARGHEVRISVRKPREPVGKISHSATTSNSRALSSAAASRTRSS